MKETKSITFDEMLGNKEYQAEFDRRIHKAIQTAKIKWEKKMVAEAKIYNIYVDWSDIMGITLKSEAQGIDKLEKKINKVMKNLPKKVEKKVEDILKKKGMI